MGPPHSTQSGSTHCDSLYVVFLMWKAIQIVVYSLKGVNAIKTLGTKLLGHSFCADGEAPSKPPGRGSSPLQVFSKVVNHYWSCESLHELRCENLFGLWWLFGRGVKEASHVHCERPSLNRGADLHHRLSVTYSAVLCSLLWSFKSSTHDSEALSHRGFTRWSLWC